MDTNTTNTIIAFAAVNLVTAILAKLTADGKLPAGSIVP